MDWLLLALAFFNAVSMLMVFRQRTFQGSLLKGMLSFAVAQIATELAWLWLPLQLVLALLLIASGALESNPGAFAMGVLVFSWIALAINIRQSFKACEEVELALQRGLGADYRHRIPASIAREMRSDVRFSDYARPFHFRRDGVELIKDVPYGKGGVRRRLDIYRPVMRPEQGCPVLLQIHGGAWIMGDKRHQGLPLMNHLAERGWICVAINYRLGPSCSFPVELTDCKDALGWIRMHGHEYGMNTDFVAVTGGSAGGHLTALMGLTQNQKDLQPTYPDADTSVQACIPFFGVYDFLGRDGLHPNIEGVIEFLQNNVMHCAPEDNPALWDLASPLTRVNASAPPFMTIHGTRDSLAPVAMARLFSQRLRAASDNASVYLELEGAEHSFELLRTPRTEFVCDGVHRFLEWVRAGGSINAP